MWVYFDLFQGLAQKYIVIHIFYLQQFNFFARPSSLARSLVCYFLLSGLAAHREYAGKYNFTSPRCLLLNLLLLEFLPSCSGLLQAEETASAAKKEGSKTATILQS